MAAVRVAVVDQKQHARRHSPRDVAELRATAWLLEDADELAKQVREENR